MTRITRCVTIELDLYTKAKAMGLNISEICNQGLAYKLGEEYKQPIKKSRIVELYERLGESEKKFIKESKNDDEMLRRAFIVARHRRFRIVKDEAEEFVALIKSQ